MVQRRPTTFVTHALGGTDDETYCEGLAIGLGGALRSSPSRHRHGGDNSVTTTATTAPARGRLAQFRDTLSARDKSALAAHVRVHRRAARRRLRRAVRPGHSAPLPPRRRPPGLQRRRRRAGLHLRAAARLRRRPHRGRRQHHPQAAGRQRRAEAAPAAPRSQAAVGRILVLPRPLDDRVRAGVRCSSSGVKALAGQVEDDDSGLHSVTGIIGASVSGRVPLDPRHPQPRRAARHRQGLPRDAHAASTTRQSSRST